MGRPASRKIDYCTGHGSYPPRLPSSASTNVFVNGSGSLRQTDGYLAHCNPSPSCHTGTVSEGSGTVFINGLAAARIGDAIDCGSAIAQGSSNVFIGK